MKNGKAPSMHKVFTYYFFLSKLKFYFETSILVQTTQVIRKWLILYLCLKFLVLWTHSVLYTFEAKFAITGCFYSNMKLIYHINTYYSRQYINILDCFFSIIYICPARKWEDFIDFKSSKLQYLSSF